MCCSLVIDRTLHEKRGHFKLSFDDGNIFYSKHPLLIMFGQLTTKRTDNDFIFLISALLKGTVVNQEQNPLNECSLEISSNVPLLQS